MTDNARIVREALIECGKQLNCSMADDLLALAALESELATAQADLERAREAIQKHKDRYFYANPDLEDYELWKVLDRAALAPEQKG